MTKLTETQQRAVKTVGRNVCVSAGAGTGKTGVLVERFLYLIERELARSHEILTVTFTEKAAQEMKVRIVTRLRERGLEEARRELENAYIGTIHSFCARVLREHPIEAGVDPDFRVLEEEEANLLEETVLDELIESRFQEPAVFELLRVYSEAGLRAAIRQIADRAHTFGISIRETLESKSSLSGPSEREVLNALEPLEKLKGKEEACAGIRAVLQQPISTWKAFESAKGIAKAFRRAGKAKDQIEAFRNAFDEWLAARIEAFAQPVKKTFLSLAVQFEAEFDKRKREIASLDFNDLERKAVRLLGSEEASSRACRKLYQNAFQFVMVDEFQDTSRLQDRLINLAARPDNLFVVGDWKQSIYGFRGADASLFLKKEEAFTKDGKGDRISLVENFRSRAELLEPVNRFFERLFSGSQGKAFEPLQAKRSSSVPGTTVPGSENPAPTLDSPVRGNDKKMLPRNDGAVEFLTIAQAEGESSEEARMKEALVLADQIRKMVDSGVYRYRDFAMLFRAGTDIFFYEYELRNFHIPYYVVSGRGFYRQPEIRDLISYLEVLENPHLDIPLAAVLRSPLVQVSDETLFWLARSSTHAKPAVPLYHAFLQSEKLQEISEADREKLKAFRAFFADLSAQKEKWSISECLELILKHTQYDRYVLGLPQGNRHFANLRKLLEMAREIENRQSIHLGDFIRYVKGLETQEVRESEAQVEALEGDVVKLMTVHKAKGLEFRVVIIPDLNRKGEKQKGRFLVDSDGSFGLRIWNEESQDFEETLTFRKIKEKMIQDACEESKRLLYVGMTRAQDHLILSGTSKGEEPEGQNRYRESGFDDGANWYEWIHHWLTLTVPGTTVPGSQNPAPAVPGTASGQNQYRGTVVPGTAETETPEPVDHILESVKPIPPVYFERLDLPVSAFSLFEHDPEEYKRVYELGVLPEESQIQDDMKVEEWAIEEDETRLSPADFGTVIHHIFEHLVSAPEKAKGKLSHYLDRFTIGLNPNEKTEIRRLSLRFLASGLFAEIKQAKRRYAEIPFVFRLRGGIIQGTLDLLYQTADGKWVILDYKTSQIQDGDLELTAQRYQRQLMLYALASQELLRIQVARAALYFVRTDQTYDFSLEGVDFSKLRGDFEKLHEAIIVSRKAWVT